MVAFAVNPLPGGELVPVFYEAVLLPFDCNHLLVPGYFGDVVNPVERVEYGSHRELQYLLFREAAYVADLFEVWRVRHKYLKVSEREVCPAVGDVHTRE